MCSCVDKSIPCSSHSSTNLPLNSEGCLSVGMFNSLQIFAASLDDPCLGLGLHGVTGT